MFNRINFTIMLHQNSPRKVMKIKWGKNDLKHTNKMIKRIYPNDDPFVDFDNSPIFPRMQSGTVVWHSKYGLPYLFLYTDNNELVFADTEGYDRCWLDCDHVEAATPEQTQMFWTMFHKNGCTYKNNKVYRSKSNLHKTKIPKIYEDINVQNAFENVCYCLYYGFSKSLWKQQGLHQNLSKTLADKVWADAVEYFNKNLKNKAL